MSSARGSAAAAPSREAVLHDLATITGVYVPVDVRRRVRRAGDHGRSRRRYPDVPAVVDKRTVADLAEWPYPKNQLVPLVEVVHDRLNVEIFRGCTRGCRFCQAGMITRPVRERPEEQVRTMVREGLRRTGYDEVALTSLSSADFSGIDGVVADLVDDQEGTGGVSVSLPSLRVDAFTVGHRERDPKGSPHGAHVRARSGYVAVASGDQQADHRRRPVHRSRRRVLAGLAPREALLPHRAADRDRRATRSGSPSSPATSSTSDASTPSRRRAPFRSAGSSRSRTRRSSGSGRTVSTSCNARSRCCATN